MMKAKEFVEKMISAANMKSLYVRGAFGAPLNETNKKRYTNNHKYNKKPDRTAKIMAATADTIAADCSGIIKGALWGFNGDITKRYGGAIYNSNGVPDVNDAGMIEACKDASKDFSKIEPGMLVWMQGHVGIYVGKGKVVESTPSFKDGVQITYLGNLGYKKGNWRNWTKCGHLPWVEYPTSMSGDEVKDQDQKNVGEYYTVKRNDVLGKIAQKHNLTLEEIMKLNPEIKNPNLIYPNQKIHIK